MNQQFEQAAGSPMWQLVFVSIALLLVLYEIVRGWRRGGARQLARLGALVALISGVGSILFKRTNQHESAFVRLMYGVTGATLGLLFGAFLVWVMIVGVRSVGAIADAHVQEQAARSTVVHAVDVRRGLTGAANEGSSELMTSLARLKNSLEMGVIGDAVKKADVLPAKTYDELGKVGRIASSPQAAERFLSYPGARELTENPKIAALRSFAGPTNHRGGEGPDAARGVEKFQFPCGPRLRDGEIIADCKFQIANC